MEQREFQLPVLLKSLFFPFPFDILLWFKPSEGLSDIIDYFVVITRAKLFEVQWALMLG